MTELSAIAAIATRDFFKFLRDRSRLVLSVLVPFLLLFLLGSTVQLNLGRAAGFNFIGFTFSGVLGMTIFQSSVQGIASLLDDRGHHDARCRRLRRVPRDPRDDGRADPVPHRSRGG
jgi:hypothetical protein